MQPSRGGGVLLATVGLLAILFAFPPLPAHAASVQVVINVNVVAAEAGAPSFTFTVTGCSVSASGSSGTPLTISPDANCVYTISAGSATGNGTLRDRLTSSYVTSVTETSCSSGTCSPVSLTAYEEELLVISANCNGPIVSVQSPTSDSWYNYGTSLTVSCTGAWGRAGGTGTRASSWNWDAGTSTLVATTGYFATSSVMMKSHHALNVNKVTQYQLTLDNGATLALGAITSPTITSDAYWYDSGTAVTYSGHGVFGRANGFGNRSASWYLDSGTPVPLSTSSTFSISITMSSPHTVHVMIRPQWQVSLDSISTKFTRSITPPTISGDNYWYDAGTNVVLIVNGTGARSGGVGSRLTSYSLNGGASIVVSTSGTFTLGFSPILGKEFITATSATQYQLLLDSGAATSLVSVTPPSIAGDNYWYDSGTQVSYTGMGVYARGSGTGVRIASWWLDSGSTTTILTTGTFSATISMLGAHTLHTATVRQFEVALTGSYSVSSATSPTISGDDYWYDTGTTVSFSLQGEFGRAAGTGLRMTSYSVNSGAPISTDTGGSVPVLSSVALTSPQAITVQSVKQYQVSFDQTVASALDTITPPTIAGDNYWYDSGSPVMLTIHGVWGRISTQGYRDSSYSINGGSEVLVASSGTVTILNLAAIPGPQVITSNSTTQYLLMVEGGPGSYYSVSPPISGDTGWYDAGTTLRVSTNGTYDSSDGTRQRISGWNIDGGQNNPVGPTTIVTTSAIVMDSAHTVTFLSVTQYLVTLIVKDSTGAHTLSPGSLMLSVNGANQMTGTSAWVDSGAALRVASVMWHGVDVAPTSPANYVVTSPLTLTTYARVYDLTIAVKDPMGFAIGGAACAVTLANGTTVHTSTAGNGTVTLQMIPLGTYQGTVSAFGLSSSLSGDASVQGSTQVAMALSWAMITVFIVVALAIVIGLVFLVRRLRKPSFKYNG